ncbi:serine/threonine-protein kinase N2-like [Xenopus tropicalis]|uniref:non-specific serine/threonine protein kinase n=1 Tax=Xenopus tropicalis TaxID=8364 RepID=A0A8J1IZF8_XENTR|nr:serine/threonine-protein kinase N2-like [Xenopus tropicalis]
MHLKESLENQGINLNVAHLFSILRMIPRGSYIESRHLFWFRKYFSKILVFFNFRLIHSIKVTGEDFNFGPVLGKGSYGKVYLAKFAKTDQIVAVKTFKKKEILKDLDCLIPERNILKLAQTEQQPFVVNIFAAFQTEYHACLAMDFAPGGDLNQQLSKRRFSEPTVV